MFIFFCLFFSVSINLFDYLGSILSYIAISFPIFLGMYDSLSGADLSSLISAVSPHAFFWYQLNFIHCNLLKKNVVNNVCHVHSLHKTENKILVKTSLY